MIVDGRTLSDGAELQADVAVVGAGPAGIVTALELAAGGIDVVLVESGEVGHDPAAQQLSRAARSDGARHTDLAVSTRRQVGGTSVLWGGRCTPYDPIDFERRQWITDAAWPVDYDELAPLLQRACDWFACGRATFDAQEVPGLAGRTIVPGLPDGEVRTSAIERWSPRPDFGRAYRTALRRSDRLRLVTGLTCTEVVCEDGARGVAWLETRRPDGASVRVRARKHVLACGGLQTTRLLLASAGGLGDHSGHLGRWYMGHVDGRIARLHFTTPPRATIHGHERDPDGVYVRRRLSFAGAFQRERRLPNTVAWIVNPELADPSHGSGALSLAYLALTSPLGARLASAQYRASLTRFASAGPRRAHVRNVVRDAGPSARFAADVASTRLLSRRRTGHTVRSAANVYPLHFHAEQIPRADSRVTLADERDALGMRRLAVDLRFSQEDVDGVLRAHRCWDEYLRRHGRGRLEYAVDDPEASVWEQANGGRHQTGTTRMSARPEDGVVDRDLAVHGFEDLFVASSSAFVTSSQAGPTFMVVVFALRLADRLRAQLR